jgi:geranylgeranyl diphosphate synthase type I
MTTQRKLMLQINKVLKQRGQKALKQAQQAVSQEKTNYKPLVEALNYFMEKVWLDFMHPAMMSLACEAAGGNPDDTIQVGAAFVLLAGGADIHDDIIDQSTTKGGMLTVFGKFGQDIAILAGDALLFKGLLMLNEAIKKLPEEKSRQILEAVKESFEGISGAEAKEASNRGRIDLTGQEYFEIIKMKVAVAAVTTRIGAILGNGTPQQIELLDHFGQTFGVLNTVRDEYIDVYESDELKNRAEKECLPLPVLLTFQDLNKKTAILNLLKQPTKEAMEKVLELTMDSKETQSFTEKMRILRDQELKQIDVFSKCCAELTLMLKASLEDL